MCWLGTVNAQIFIRLETTKYENASAAMCDLVCTLCRREFDTASHLKRHLAKKVACRVPNLDCKNCDKKFTTARGRDIHQKSCPVSPKKVTPAQSPAPLAIASKQVDSALLHDLRATTAPAPLAIATKQVDSALMHDLRAAAAPAVETVAETVAEYMVQAETFSACYVAGRDQAVINDTNVTNNVVNVTITYPRPLEVPLVISTDTLFRVLRYLSAEDLQMCRDGNTQSLVRFVSLMKEFERGSVPSFHTVYFNPERHDLVYVCVDSQLPGAGQAADSGGLLGVNLAVPKLQFITLAAALQMV